MKLQHRIALIGLAGAVVAGFVYTQLYIHKKNRQELEEIARELAYTWQYKLGLNEEQTLHLENVIIAFTIKKNEILNSILSEDAKIERLQAIQRAEHKSLQRFLEKDQFEEYLRLNKQMTRKLSA
ncbi:MAG: hypothetical protein WCE57_00585 [Salegentibacter sp.]